MPAAPNPGDPYCSNCGHQLTGLTESSKCPECGRPLVEILVRGGRFGRRYRSTTTLFGLPLVDLAFGATAGEPVGRATGVFAFGDKATGLVAIGGQARGIVAIGGVAIGLVAIGGVSIGFVAAWGGVALGLLAAGGVAMGGLTSGGLTVGFVASGGLAIGYYAFGGAPLAVHALGPGVQSDQAVAMLTSLRWFYGPPGFTIWTLLQPLIAIFGLAFAAIGVIGLLAFGAHVRAGDTMHPS